MYYCSRSKNIPYSLEKINARMVELSKIIPEVAAQPGEGELEMVGDLNYNHPVTDLLLEYRVLMYKARNPPDPRGDKMYSRAAPYIERAYAQDLAIVLNIHERTIQRAIQAVHKKLELKMRSWVTVDEFIELHQLPNREAIHEKLSQLMIDQWKQVKDRQKKNGDGK
jgi:hypothetical protein